MKTSGSRCGAWLALGAFLQLHCAASDPAVSPHGGTADASNPPGDEGPTATPDAPSTVDAKPADESAPVDDAGVVDVVTADARAPEDAVATDAGNKETGPMGPVSHRFLSGISHEGAVNIIAKDGTLEWSYSPGTPETNDAWYLPNGNVVLAVRTGVREVTPAKTIVWEYNAPSGAEVHAVQPLPGDLFMVGESHSDGTSVIYEMNRSKTISRTIPITQLGGGVHAQFREVRKTPQGTYITSQQKGGGKAMEFDAQGKLLRTFPCGRFVGIRLPDGNTLISCGDDHRVIEVDPQNTIVWEVKQNDIPGNPLAFAAGLQRLPNGNTVICNWQGHIDGGTSPQAFEITRDKKVVWEVRDAKLGWISSIEILDPEAAVGGVMLR